MKTIVMLGTGMNTMGGVSSVVKVYAQAGLLRRYGVRYLATHCDGGKWRKLGVMCRAYAAFIALLLRGEVGLIHVHLSSRASFWRKSGFFLLAFAARVPAILHLHGAEFNQFYGDECGPWRKRFVRFIFDHAARVVVLSEAWRRWVQGMSRNPRVEAIYNPVLLPPASDWAARRPGAVLSLGRLGRRKGSYDLLQAAARVAPQVSGLELRLGGDGELDAVRARAAQLGLASQLNLLGWVGAEGRQQQLALASLYALPSYNEGLPMSVLEAMAAGLPVLATPVGGIPEAVADGVEGFLVAPGDVEALAARLAQLLEDDALARRMGAAARRKVESTFSSDAVLPQVERLYRELGFMPR
ncbi:glycosyltransferase family 4 protein [Pseudoduganella violaceinigra]|uniref:glycosyltransferase family 4 protein n=1 Tax=Pseudoduganella violaceinigra TaxID=246602 RepID=UPI00041E896E|nr:glycosyltransferase family 4 protein [Pseudoduganella violaceinigra]